MIHPNTKKDQPSRASLLNAIDGYKLAGACLRTAALSPLRNNTI